MQIVIVGAGVIGVSAAWYLHADGHEVTVIEREPGPALETSFANGGHVSGPGAAAWAAPDVPLKALKWLGRRGAPIRIAPRPDARMLAWLLQFLRECGAKRAAVNTEAVQRLAAHSRAALAVLDAQLELPRDRNDAGQLALARTQRELDEIAREMELWREMGLSPRVLDAREILDVEPALVTSNNRYLGGLYNEGGESGDARAFTEALAEHCRKAGVAFRFNTTTERILLEGGRATGVVTAAGAIAADIVVLAAGSFTLGLLAGTGVRLPIYPGKGYSVTVPVRASNAVPRLAVTDEHAKLVFVRLGDRFRAAGTLEFSGYDRRVDPKRAGAVLAAMRQIFPQAGDYAAAEPWAGLRPMTPDGRPAIGPTRVPGLWLCTGHGPLGWTLAAGSGQLLAELIAGRESSVDPALASPARF